MSTEWSDLAERTEAIAMRRMCADQPDAVKERLGISVHDAAEGVHTVIARDPMWGYWNKALGFTSTVSRDTVEEVVTRARELGAPAMGLLLQPRVVPDDWDEIAAACGLTQGTLFVKCFGPLSPREAPTDLRIERLDASHAEAFTAVMAEGFGFDDTPEAHALFDSEHYFEGDWASYGAFDADALVAVGRMLVVPETDSVALFGAATLPAGRNRGAQGALIDARVRDGLERGLRHASFETWMESEGNPNPSQHNARRAGLTEVHARHSWVWRP